VFQNLGASEISAINRLTLEVCANPKLYGELSQLRTLFHARFTRRLEGILKRSLIVLAGGPRHVEVSLGWIDKIPLARSDQLGGTPGVFERTELGDAVIFAFDNVHGPTGAVVRQDARALLLQAKVTREAGQLLAPKVPLASIKRPSTRKEYTLLSTWPTFDLYKSSGSRTPLRRGIDLRPGGSPERYGWYIGAPASKIADPAVSPWRSWWMSAPPQTSMPLQATMGELFVSFLSAQPLMGVAVGEAFSPGATSSDWSGLCTTVLDLVEQQVAPPSLFAPGQRRLVRISFEAAAFLSPTATFGNAPDFLLGRHPWALDQLQLWPNTLRRAAGWRQVEAWRRGGEPPARWWAGFRRRLPVLTITATRKDAD